VTATVEAAAASPRPRLELADVRLRSNPRLTLIPFGELSSQERATLGEAATDPSLYGAARDDSGGVKIVDHDSALLLRSLREPARLPHGIGADGRTLVRLVLDGVLELEATPGVFASGSRAYEALYGSPPAPRAETKTARLSQAALRYGQHLEFDDPLRLSARLYFYGRLPATPERLARLPTRAAVERFLGIDARGVSAQTLRRSWAAVDAEAPNDGWFLWARRGSRRRDGSGDRFKLYVSPLPDSLPAAFAAAVDAAGAAGADALKVGNDALSLLRPDKLVLYFRDFEGVQTAADRLATELDGCRGHGVPFTAELADDGLVSWGVDPPRAEHRLPWQERESWRLWLTNRLALALLVARRDGGAEPWRYALARVELEGVDPATWATVGDPWGDEGAAS
jgi:hypothetical protein